MKNTRQKMAGESTAETSRETLKTARHGCEGTRKISSVN
jgi:hypothetical protein